MIYLLAIIQLFSLGQVDGKVLDADTQKPIPYAYIQFLDDDGTYITTNAEGVFQFEAIGNRQKGRLYMRSLGYEETTLDYDVKNGTTLTIELQPKVFELPEVEITDRIVKPAILGEKDAPTDGMLKNLRNPAILFDLNKDQGQLTNFIFLYQKQMDFLRLRCLLTSMPLGPQ